MQALSAVDLHLVMFVCEYVDPAQVFSQAVCPLEQPVLLSLIQQLSADLENNTELKHRYVWTGMEVICRVSLVSAKSDLSHCSVVVNPLRAKFSEQTKTYIYILCHSSTLTWHR